MAQTVSPTSYALLGLLSLKSWTTYELARQSERSLRWFFPRAERAVYQEAKRLVELGWAAPEATWSGRRRGTTYTITKAGRRALGEWLREPSAPLLFESEGLMKTFFADQAGLDVMRGQVTAMGNEARAALDRLAEMARQWTDGTAPFRDRGPTNAVSMRLVTELNRTVAEWAEWAQGAIKQIERGAAPARRLAENVFADIGRGSEPIAG